MKEVVLFITGIHMIQLKWLVKNYIGKLIF